MSDKAFGLLKELKKTARGNFIFSLDGRAPIRRETPRKYLRESLKSEGTMHGMRSTFRDWCAESVIPDAIAEKCLMHSTGTETFTAYQRSDLLEQRRKVMQAWADELFGQSREDLEKTDLLHSNNEI